MAYFRLRKSKRYGFTNLFDQLHHGCLGIRFHTCQSVGESQLPDLAESVLIRQIIFQANFRYLSTQVQPGNRENCMSTIKKLIAGAALAIASMGTLAAEQLPTITVFKSPT